MSFNRLNYDTCTYKHNLRQSVGPGDYMIDTPKAECQACFPVESQVKNMPMHWFDDKAVDISSDLLGLTRKATNCPDNKWIPNSGSDYGNPQTYKDCMVLPNEHTRVSNPPCTLRSSGWNRFEWLCKNPQDKAIPEFDINIANRIVVKDNHRPYIQRPLDQTAALPRNHASEDIYVGWKPCARESDIDSNTPSTTWKPCNYFDKYAAMA